jgi:hypothetical protein
MGWALALFISFLVIVVGYLWDKDGVVYFGFLMMAFSICGLIGYTMVVMT